jgi:hypothetical protein
VDESWYRDLIEPSGDLESTVSDDFDAWSRRVAEARSDFLAAIGRPEIEPMPEFPAPETVPIDQRWLARRW